MNLTHAQCMLHCIHTLSHTSCHSFNESPSEQLNLFCATWRWEDKKNDKDTEPFVLDDNRTWERAWAFFKSLLRYLLCNNCNLRL